MLSKLSNTLRMLILLKSRGKMTLQEIADELEVSKRQVIRYREDLDKAGIYVTSTPGKYGGYTLEGKDYILGLNVTNEEYLTLLAAQEHLKYENFIGYKDLKTLVDKIGALRECENSMDFDFYIKNTKSSYNLQKEKEIWFDIKAAIISNRKIKILYKSAKRESSSRIVHPYYIFQYKGSMYFAGYCEYRQEMRDFKISRVGEHKILEEKFQKSDDFNLENYMKNCFGIFKDEELFIKLEIEYPMAQIVKEKIWVDNQRIEELDHKDAILFKARVRGMTEIKSWILSMGSDVRVIEPKYLKEEIQKEARQLLENYK